ncbi:AfsA-related hotdog domain-containing protein [Streptomyces sp. NPDC085944]|uniref:AfsA-related hotdog domain-containing protein n=1 Tax=Streptomyces sp. NPDC085944 TaxID=3154962 RepID=UPI003445A0D1
MRTVVEQCAYAALQSAGLLRDREVPLNTWSSSRLLVKEPPLDETRGGLLARSRVDLVRATRSGRTRRVRASCVITSATTREAVAVGETLAGILERRLYRAWRGPSVTRAGDVQHPLPPEPGVLHAVRARPENQVVAGLSRRPDGRFVALLRLPAPHRYLLPPSSDHVTGRVFAEATRQVVLAASSPGATVRSMDLAFRHLCTLEGPVRIEAGAVDRQADTAAWCVTFRKAGTTVCAATAETLG